MKANSLRFATVARTLGDAARQRRLEVPSFRSPPRAAGAERTLRRTDGGTVVAVRLRGRPFVAVVADMVEGIVVVNQLDGVEATKVRTALWEAVTKDDEVVAA